MCVDGSKQRREPNYKKEDNASPTVSNGGILVGCAIDAWERRDAASMCLQGAFLQAYLLKHLKENNMKEVIMCLKGNLAKLMFMVKPTLYCKYLTHDKKGTAMLYVTMNKALYGLLASALVFYKKLVAELKAYGFKVNPYDPCVSNMDINGSQMTVFWHVDDLKVSHKDTFEVTKFSTDMSGVYGEKMTVTQGLVHEYLGMGPDFS